MTTDDSTSLFDDSSLPGMNDSAASDAASSQGLDAPWQPRAAGDLPRTLARLLGLPRQPGDDTLSLLDRRVEDGLIVEDFNFDSEPGETVSGMLAKPEGHDEPLPAILCLHGINQGRKTIMGDRYYYDTRLSWLRGWGRELARYSFVTAGITMRTFGKRPGTLGEQGKVELLYGRTLMGAFVWEALQALDRLAERSDVDSSRLGIMGFGLGGTVAFYTAALDDRVKAIVTACGGIGSMDLFAHWAHPDFHDLSYFVPGILDQFDHPEIASSLAPRAYLLLTRDSDAGMPMEGVRRVEWEGGSGYRDLAVEDRLKVSARPGSHDFTAEDLTEATDWFTRWLSEDAKRAFTVSQPDALVSED